MFKGPRCLSRLSAPVQKPHAVVISHCGIQSSMSNSNHSVWLMFCGVMYSIVHHSAVWANLARVYWWKRLLLDLDIPAENFTFGLNVHQSVIQVFRQLYVFCVCFRQWKSLLNITVVNITIPSFTRGVVGSRSNSSHLTSTKPTRLHPLIPKLTHLHP